MAVHGETTAKGDLTRVFGETATPDLVPEWSKDQGLTPDQILKNRVFNAGMKEGAQETMGFIDGGNAKQEILVQKTKQEKSEKFKNLLRRLFQNMENWSVADHIREFNIFADWMDQKADEFEQQARDERKQIETNIEKMQANSEFIGEADGILGKDKKDIDPAKIRELLKKRGVEVDDDVPLVVLLEKLEAERNNANQENERLETENKIHEENAVTAENTAETYRTQAKEIREKTQEIENNPNLSEEQKKQMLEQLWKDVPKEILEKYEAEYGQTEYTFARRQELENEEMVADPSSKLVKGTVKNEFQAKVDPDPDEIKPDETSPPAPPSELDMGV